MKVAPGVEMLEVSATLMSGPGTFYPTLLWDQKDAVLVDAGLPNMAEEFVRAIGEADVALEKLGRIIITHHDLDHLGSLGDLQQRLPNLTEVLAHAEEAPYIQGEKPAIKLTPKMLAQMEEQMKGVPAEHRQAMREMMENIGKQKLKVTKTVSDGEELPYCGGIAIIHTPGHTPGHICLYHKASKTLIAGDALFVEDNKLSPPPSFINADASLAMQSIKRLLDYDIGCVIAYHGGCFQNNPNERLWEMVQGKA